MGKLVFDLDKGNIKFFFEFLFIVIFFTNPSRHSPRAQAPKTEVKKV